MGHYSLYSLLSRYNDYYPLFPYCKYNKKSFHISRNLAYWECLFWHLFSSTLGIWRKIWGWPTQFYHLRHISVWFLGLPTLAEVCPRLSSGLDFPYNVSGPSPEHYNTNKNNWNILGTKFGCSHFIFLWLEHRIWGLDKILCSVSCIILREDLLSSN